MQNSKFAEKPNKFNNKKQHKKSGVADTLESGFYPSVLVRVLNEDSFSTCRTQSVMDRTEAVEPDWGMQRIE